MEIFWIILKFIIANILAIIVSSTLVGFIIRGILQPGINTNHGNHMAEYYALSRTKGRILSFGSAGITILLLIILIRYSNIYIVLGFLSLIASRIKDLIKEIKTGVKTTNRTMTNSSLDFVLNLFSWVGFIVFNYGLYILLI